MSELQAKWLLVLSGAQVLLLFFIYLNTFLTFLNTSWLKNIYKRLDRLPNQEEQDG
jgi:hypothetical protein